MRLLILYGSQTGYCQETAERIYREAKRYHLEPELLAMDDYDRTRLPTEELVVFACSVTGQGDPPDNMRKFWRFLLRKDIPNDALSQMHFGVFGQGDSSYEKFNTPAKKLHKRLLQLGANPLLARGDGDDQHYLGVDGALDPWLQELWTAVLSKYPLKPGLQVISENVLPQPNFTIQFTTNSDLQVPTLEMHHGSVKENERLTSSQHFQDVRHLEIETTAGYEPGDIFVVYPKNDPEMVQRALDYFGWTEMADLPIQIEAKEVKINPRLLQCKSLRELLTDYLDLFGKPRRYFFWLLSYFCADERHAEKLLELSSTEGQDELYGYAHRVRRTTFEVLQDFSSVKMPLQYLLDLIPPMRPRSFSISSSPSAHPNSIHLTVAIVEYQTRLQEPRKGVCTFWMKGWKAGGT
ncbi:hypothetical protein EDD86DRAFT_196835 [Gorgonomyces haynaldii]|nr:hypothetical protein EDD86DRAFT_196835 [Gorgonomyces haynaldii]